MRFPPYDPLRLLDRHLIGATALVRREVLADTGGFDASFALYEDWELWLAALAHGWHGVRVDAVTLEYRRHGASKLGADRRRYRELRRQLRSKHAALYARRRELREHSTLGSAGRAAYRWFWGPRPLPAVVERIVYQLLWGRHGSGAPAARAPRLARMSSQIRRALRPVAIGAERVVWGAEHRRRLFEALLSGHYGSRRRRVWRYVEREDAPHFFDQRHNALALVTGDGNVEGFLRAFYALDVTRAGDEVLDIGCGDGFFARHFLASRAAHVDAVDIEPSAIAHARRVHPHPRVHHQLLDAVTEPFPRAAYDVIVFDGALGHFPATTTDGVLAKIAQALKPGGVFVGSETLGRREGHDHLQFFESLDELGTTLKAHFAHVALREAQYEIEGGLERREAFWRCAIDEPGVRRSAWRSFEQ